MHRSTKRFESTAWLLAYRVPSGSELGGDILFFLIIVQSAPTNWGFSTIK